MEVLYPWPNAAATIIDHIGDEGLDSAADGSILVGMTQASLSSRRGDDDTRVEGPSWLRGVTWSPLPV
jgi:hypothetical protein